MRLLGKQRLLVLPYVEPDKTIGGIIIPHTNTNLEMLKGKVINITDDVKHAKVNDMILYSKNCRYEKIEHEDVLYHLIHETDIYSIVEL